MNNKRRSQQNGKCRSASRRDRAATFCLVYPALSAVSCIVLHFIPGRRAHADLPRENALILGAIALGIVLAMIIYTFAIAELYYGGVENMARQVYGTLGIDFDTLMNSLGQ